MEGAQVTYMTVYIGDLLSPNPSGVEKWDRGGAGERCVNRGTLF